MWRCRLYQNGIFFLTDVIEEILKQQAEIPPQLKLVANYYSYDSDVTIYHYFHFFLSEWFLTIFKLFVLLTLNWHSQFTTWNLLCCVFHFFRKIQTLLYSFYLILSWYLMLWCCCCRYVIRSQSSWWTELGFKITLRNHSTVNLSL